MDLLKIKNLKKSFGGVKAVENVSIDIKQNAIIGLIGPNGSGKTTLFSSIVGSIPIDSGSILFEGNEISNLTIQEIARLGLVRSFQETHIFSKMSCLENVLISAPRAHDNFRSMFQKYSKLDKEMADSLLEFVGLKEKRETRARDLSFGQQKLLELAMVVRNQPKLLLLDEPTAGINPTLINALVDGLKTIHKELGVTLFIIEHNMRVIMGLAEHIYCMAHGKLLAQGSPHAIQNDEKVIDAYLGKD